MSWWPFPRTSSRGGPARVHTATRFEGLSVESIGAGGTGLFEVTTSSGVPVRLHDMSFVSLTYEPSSPPALTLRFGYHDPAWTPAAAADTPVAVFTFTGVLVLEHRDEPVPPDVPQRALRQVGGFDADEGSGTFALSTFTTYLVFTASSLSLTLEPAAVTGDQYGTGTQCGNDPAPSAGAGRGGGREGVDHDSYGLPDQVCPAPGGHRLVQQKAKASLVPCRAVPEGDRPARNPSLHVLLPGKGQLRDNDGPVRPEELVFVVRHVDRLDVGSRGIRAGVGLAVPVGIEDQEHVGERQGVHGEVSCLFRVRGTSYRCRRRAAPGWARRLGTRSICAEVESEASTDSSESSCSGRRVSAAACTLWCPSSRKCVRPQCS